MELDLLYRCMLGCHGALEYDDSGNAIGQPKGSARMLAGMIKQVNQHIQKHYKIGKPQFLTVPKSQNFGSKKKTFLGRLNKLQKDINYIDGVLKDGGKRADLIASKKVREMKKLIGF